jgi:quercetin dioxygenase-like cupin family protein
MPDPTILAVEDGAVLADRAERTVRALSEHPLLDATWSRFEAGEAGASPHVHHRHVDAFYVVEGELQFRVGPDLEAVRAPAGTFVLVPPEVVHAFDNASDERARWLNFHAPSTGFIAWLRGDLPAFDSDDPPPDGGLTKDHATVIEPGAHGLLGDTEQMSVRELAVEPGEAIELGGEGFEALFVLEGELDRAGALTWLAAPPRSGLTLRSDKPGARLLSIRAPG